ncbi:hypothetical protein DNTS_002788 [Danionella cerebrum]|uniref:Uncharacterized protein n=1 Tax=Danionella cerebrum TaxID=2873325 RepID=A0A553MKY0_9TELE|nr:hypothetical protein DNTS_002788 [Danionella translucida]TRY53831.1 hypothetical protein DNTS_002788 [Danionella translucida]
MAFVKENKIVRVVLIILSQVAFIAALVINALAGPGKGPFQHSTGNISAQYETEITPAGWTFSIWGVIYSWLLLMNLFLLSWFCRGLYSSPAVLPSEFFLSWIINMILNSTWLVLWDRELMVAAMIVLALIAFTNFLMIYFSCVGLDAHGSWLKQNHPKEHLCIIVLVQNGIATYATWTTIATLLNFTVVLSLASVSAANAATTALSILLLEVIVWFSVENFLIEKHVRYILSVYPVVIFALSGSLSKHYDSVDPGRNAIFSAVLLALACIVFVLRLALVVWRHRTQPLFCEPNSEVLMSTSR